MNPDRVAVVLFSLGGPDRPEAVRGFLSNLFADPLIFRVPGPVRRVLARLIVAARAGAAAENYRAIGGASPLLAQTNAQAEALEAELSRRAGAAYRVFVAMRYWHPFARETAAEVAAWKPDAVVALPLYPQFSTTTTQSSLLDWEQAAREAGIACPQVGICGYPEAPGWIAALAGTVAAAAAAAPDPSRLRVVFSAHGLPLSVVRAGDPYPVQVAATVRAVAALLGGTFPDRVLGYQSRVGPMRWTGPETAALLRAAAADGRDVVAVPVAFVSEHVETLAEMDRDFARLAAEAGVGWYGRAATVGTRPDFIAALADLVRSAEDRLSPAPAWTFVGEGADLMRRALFPAPETDGIAP